MEKRTRRSPARFLAPLALIAALVAFLAIVNGSSTNNSSTTDTTTTPTQQTTSTAKKKAAGAAAGTKTAKSKSSTGKTTYTVQVGDTLGGIADKTGIPLARIQTLNPNVDPHAMVTGQKIRLK
jgi:LysM repeat protein